MVRPSSTARPSIWWNTGLCVASSASLRKHLPGLTTYSGSGLVSMALICTGEVCVRSTMPDRVRLAAGTRHEEGVLHLPGGMVGREVQRVEVVPLGLDLGSLGDLVAHADEHVGQPVGERRDRVPGAGRVPVPRQRHVRRLVDQHPAVPVGLEFGLPRGDGVVEGLPGDADPAAGLGLGLRRQRADLGAGQRQRRLAAAVRDLGRLQIVEAGRRRDRGQACCCHAFDLGRRQHGGPDRVVALVRCGHRPDLLDVAGSLVRGEIHDHPQRPAPAAAAGRPACGETEDAAYRGKRPLPGTPVRPPVSADHEGRSGQP